MIRIQTKYWPTLSVQEKTDKEKMKLIDELSKYYEVATVDDMPGMFLCINETPAHKFYDYLYRFTNEKFGLLTLRDKAENRYITCMYEFLKKIRTKYYLMQIFKTLMAFIVKVCHSIKSAFLVICATTHIHLNQN